MERKKSDQFLTEIKPLKTFEREHNDSIETIQFNPNKPKMFMSASHDSKIKIWNIENDTSSKDLTGPE